MAQSGQRQLCRLSGASLQVVTVYYTVTVYTVCTVDTTWPVFTVFTQLIRDITIGQLNVFILHLYLIYCIYK